MKNDITGATYEVSRAAVPVSVGGATLMGVPLADWVLILTLLYTVFLIVDKFPAVLARLVALGRWLKELYGRIR